ncbi:MAG: hypothetical protein QM793_13195 [Muricomes sp.]
MELGFQGKKKRISDKTIDAFGLFIGGEVGEGNTHLAEDYGDLPAAVIPEFLYELALELKGKNLELMDYLSNYKNNFFRALDNYFQLNLPNNCPCILVTMSIITIVFFFILSYNVNCCNTRKYI